MYFVYVVLLTCTGRLAMVCRICLINYICMKWLFRSLLSIGASKANIEIDLDYIDFIYRESLFSIFYNVNLP